MIHATRTHRTNDWAWSTRSSLARPSCSPLWCAWYSICSLSSHWSGLVAREWFIGSRRPIVFKAKARAAANRVARRVVKPKVPAAVVDDPRKKDKWMQATRAWFVLCSEPPPTCRADRTMDYMANPSSTSTATLTYRSSRCPPRSSSTVRFACPACGCGPLTMRTRIGWTSFCLHPFTLPPLPRPSCTCLWPSTGKYTHTQRIWLLLLLCFAGELGGTWLIEHTHTHSLSWNVYIQIEWNFQEWNEKN